MSTTMRRGLSKDGAWRQMLLKRAGVSQADVARAVGVPESTVSRVLAGTYPWTDGDGLSRRAKVEAYVAEAIGLSPERAFPKSRATWAPEKENPRR